MATAAAEERLKTINLAYAALRGTHLAAGPFAWPLRDETWRDAPSLHPSGRHKAARQNKELRR